MEGRLNIMQKAMLDWNELHPYNAIHVARVPDPLDQPCWNASFARTWKQRV
jgi:hypothetical protein